VAKRADGGLGFFDRVMLFTAWLVSCGLVFLLGYYVGKGERRQRTTEVAQRVVLPVAPLETTGEQPTTSPTLTFYDQLGRDPGRGAAPAEPPRATIPPKRTTTSTRPAAAPPPPSPPTTVLAPVRSPVTTSTRPEPPAPPPPREPVAAPPPPVAPPDRPGRTWTVYVSPTRDRFEAERQRASLAAQGYDASVVRMQRDGDTWYRVRVGRYPDKPRADSVRQELRDRLGVDHAFVLEE
jgi:cell division protein FtsN